MSVIESDEKYDVAVMRSMTKLYEDLCDCAGPQPSIGNTRMDEHSLDCPYSLRVEAEVRAEHTHRYYDRQRERRA